MKYIYLYMALISSGRQQANLNMDLSSVSKRIRKNQNNELSAYYNDLHDALMEKNGSTFWKIWRSKFECKNKPLDVEGYSNATIIADKLANFFSSAAQQTMLLVPLSYLLISHACAITIVAQRLTMIMTFLPS